MRSLGFALLALGAVSLLPPLGAGNAQAACGDGVIDGEEACDGADLGGKTCADVTSGFAQTGTLTCRPDCTLEVADCRRAFIESLVPATGGGRQNRCHLEWATVGTEPVRGRPTKRTCSEGIPPCDQDGNFDNFCTFRIQVCLNVPDPRIGGCEPGRIVKLDVLAPSLGTDTGKEIASAILAAARSAAPDQARIGDGAVAYGPPVTEFTCGSASFRVPLRGTTGRARPSTVRLRARTSDNSGRVKAVGKLALTCVP